MATATKGKRTRAAKPHPEVSIDFATLHETIPVERLTFLWDVDANRLVMVGYYGIVQPALEAYRDGLRDACRTSAPSFIKVIDGIKAAEIMGYTLEAKGGDS